MSRVHGLHHITAIAGKAQENLDFYAGVLGMRLVKRSVNQDDPGTYHLFYADAAGSPGADLTFFPWNNVDAPPRLGHGLAVEVGLEIPAGTSGFWVSRLERYGVSLQATERRFGDLVLPFADPHGLRVTLVEPAQPAPRLFEAWDGGPVAGEHQIRGLHGARAWEREFGPTADFLQRVVGLDPIGTEDGWTRFASPDAAGVIDVKETPHERRGAWGIGSVHHLAWRVRDEAHQLEIRAQVAAAGGRPTPVIDRFWFKSVYFKEPGGVLFEIATDGPGFGIDEDRAHLGESLVLPPFLERSRPRIETSLPAIELPHLRRSAR